MVFILRWYMIILIYFNKLYKFNYYKYLVSELRFSYSLDIISLEYFLTLDIIFDYPSSILDFSINLSIKPIRISMEFDDLILIIIFKLF